jgi:hypothetical protein
MRTKLLTSGTRPCRQTYGAALPLVSHPGHCNGRQPPQIDSISLDFSGREGGALRNRCLLRVCGLYVRAEGWLWAGVLRAARRRAGARSVVRCAAGTTAVCCVLPEASSSSSWLWLSCWWWWWGRRRFVALLKLCCLLHQASASSGVCSNGENVRACMSCAAQECA